MFKSRTVFIVGAGASQELNLPVGAGLKPKISNILRMDDLRRYKFADPYIHKAIVDSETNPNIPSSVPTHDTMLQFRDLAAKISRSMPSFPSIDTFLDAMRDNKRINLLGKLAIARTILIEEQRSAIFHKEHNQFLIPSSAVYYESWLPALWANLIVGIHKDNVETIFDNVSFIIFNYDRCVEHFLFLMLTDAFDLDQSKGREIMERLQIIHPYGQVGYLPWQRKKPTAAFGEAEPEHLLQVARSLLTFTESENVGMKDDILQTMRNAESLVLLGFGYLSDNMRLLDGPTSIKRVLMTTYKMHFSNRQAAVQNVARMIGRIAQENYQGVLNPNEFQVLRDVDSCKELWDSYSLIISSEAPQ